MSKYSQEDLLALLGGTTVPDADAFEELVTRIDSHEVLAKVYLLEGAPHVFESSPMKYVIFREQVAERFGVGSQDVCIVGSAKLGFSPSAHHYGQPFSETSDVDVVLISDSLFYVGSRALFTVLNQLGPPLHKVRPFLFGQSSGETKPVVDLHDWRSFKEATRNFVYENFNPGLLPSVHPLRIEIFNKISSTAGLFLALEPRVFVSRIRCRVFKNWRAAEDYYANSLRELRNYFKNHQPPDEEIDEPEESSDQATKTTSS